MDYSVLADRAFAAKEEAYVPYSRFRVGAAVLLSDGHIFTGSNIENASYGLTVCAERIAVFKAVSEGRKDITAVAVAGDTEEYIVPCGACRQVIREFGRNIDIVMCNKNREYEVRKLEELLPQSFGPEFLEVSE